MSQLDPVACGAGEYRKKWQMIQLTITDPSYRYEEMLEICLFNAGDK